MTNTNDFEESREVTKTGEILSSQKPDADDIQGSISKLEIEGKKKSPIERLPAEILDMLFARVPYQGPHSELPTVCDAFSETMKQPRFLTLVVREQFPEVLALHPEAQRSVLTIETLREIIDEHNEAKRASAELMNEIELDLSVSSNLIRAPKKGPWIYQAIAFVEMKQALVYGTMLLNHFGKFRTRSKVNNGVLAELAKRHCYSRDALMRMKLAFSRACTLLIDIDIIAILHGAYSDEDEEMRLIEKHVQENKVNWAEVVAVIKQRALEAVWLCSDHEGPHSNLSGLHDQRDWPGERWEISQDTEENVLHLLRGFIQGLIGKDPDSMDSKMPIGLFGGLKWRLLETSNLRSSCEPKIDGIVEDDLGDVVRSFIFQHREFVDWQAALKSGRTKLIIDFDRIGRALPEIAKDLKHKRRELVGETIADVHQRLDFRGPNESGYTITRL